MKAALSVMTLPYSDVFHVSAYPRECPESFQAGHVAAFNFSGGYVAEASCRTRPDKGIDTCRLKCRCVEEAPPGTSVPPSENSQIRSSHVHTFFQPRFRRWHLTMAHLAFKSADHGIGPLCPPTPRGTCSKTNRGRFASFVD